MVVNRVEGCREIKENENRGERGCLRSLEGFKDGKEGSLS